jgi:hypothetical protein
MRIDSRLSVETGVIIALVIYILYLTQCKGPAPCPEGRGIRVDTVTRVFHDTTKPKTVTIYRPGDTIWKDGLPPEHLRALRNNFTMVHDTFEIVKEIPTMIDTQAVIQDYYSKIIQKDSIRYTDGKVRIKVKITDTVYQNRIIGRWWALEYSPPESLQKKAQFYFGGGFHTSLFLNKGLSSQTISAGHVDLGYINKKGQHLKLDLMRTGGLWHEGISFYHTFGK